MSPSVFVAELKLERYLCIWLIGSVVLLLLLGVWTIVNLPIGRELRWLGSAGWGLAVGVRGGLLAASQRRYRQVNIYADGSLFLRDRGGGWQAASLGNNSVVLSRLAWIDLVPADGRRFCGLFLGNSCENEQWRRLQVIWRHPGSSLGSGS